MQKIVVNGKEYPCRITMGAFLLFHEKTGREANEMSSKSLSDLIIFIWCCIKSACRADKVEFDMTVEEFADASDPEKLNTFYESNVEPEDKKKEKADLKG